LKKWHRKEGTDMHLRKGDDALEYSHIIRAISTTAVRSGSLMFLNLLRYLNIINIKPPHRKLSSGLRILSIIYRAEGR
jgi:hypothetical protein